MKYLCFSDLHCNQDAAKRLVELAQDVDMVIGAGDFANQHRGIMDTIDILSQIQKPSVLVPGNGETVEELRSATANWDSAVVLHGEGCEIQSVAFGASAEASRSLHLGIGAMTLTKHRLSRCWLIAHKTQSWSSTRRRLTRSIVTAVDEFEAANRFAKQSFCLLYTSPSPRDRG